MMAATACCHCGRQSSNCFFGHHNSHMNCVMVRSGVGTSLKRNRVRTQTTLCRSHEFGVKFVYLIHQILSVFVLHLHPETDNNIIISKVTVVTKYWIVLSCNYISITKYWHVSWKKKCIAPAAPLSYIVILYSNDTQAITFTTNSFWFPDNWFSSSVVHWFIYLITYPFNPLLV